MRSNGAVDDTQHFTHDGWLTGEQKAQRERYTQHPLTHGLKRQDFVYQQGGTVHHSARTATAAPKVPTPPVALRCRATNSQMAFVLAAREHEPALNSQDLVDRIATQFGLSVHSRSVERALRRKKTRFGT